MALIDESKNSKAWSICPYLQSSFGIFFNCGVGNNSNMETFMCATSSQVLILMNAKHDINKD